MKLYPLGSYFTTEEFACRCGCDFGTEEKHIDENLIEMLNMMRLLHGQPMVVTSGARCDKHNHAVGGVANSAHLPHPLTRQCRAVDILVKDSETRFDLVHIALRLGVTRIGLAKDFLHFDVAWDLPDPRMFNY
jgi:uncharacterized protein YcbK (DUF882 family)